MPHNDDKINEYVDSIIHPKANATLTPPQSSTKRIPQVRGIVSKEGDYEKYYVPKVVSIGPYHYGKEKLQAIQNLKPGFAKKIFKGKRETLKSLYKKLLEPEMVNYLRGFYDEDSTNMNISDTDFTYMMLLDSCFILYYTQFIYFRSPEDSSKLKSYQIVLAHQDLFLLENQIPIEVIRQVAHMTEIDLEVSFRQFLNESRIVKPLWSNTKPFLPEFKTCNHILHVLHGSLTDSPMNESSSHLRNAYNYRNVSELVGVGIHFGPSSRMSLAHVEFSKGLLRFLAHVKLPRITVDDSTKYMLLNMITYETYFGSIKDAWVTSYVCFLDSLIDHPDDVKILRKSWVLETSLGSDEEVAKLFNEIGTDLVPYYDAYFETRHKIQKHYDSYRNTLFTQLKNEYFNSPWAIFAILGALIAVFLGCVQTYYTRWSPKGECDDLCRFLKIYNHL
ncbi:UPF0481 protein At3g47200-like [Bidens hawaiensis]|uniref:UPF0481 protein At3g47200-like n=1 Tax=Bidens hawaiensis TaxID=980011 RepID=UPI004048F314